MKLIPSVRSLCSLRLHRALLISLPVMAALAVSGCGSGSGGGSQQKTLKTVTISPASASIGAGATQQLKATATYSDGSTADITSQATWASAAGSVATVSSSGMVTGVAAGSTTVSASDGGASGTAAITVTAAAPTLSSIALSPATASIAVGATQQFTATGTYSDGSTSAIASGLTWTSSNSAVAGVSSSGLATGAGAGGATITAAMNGVSGTASLTVAAKTISSIGVSPNPASFAVGATQQFTATATYSDGTTADISSTATWTSSNTAVATIAAGGLATGVASGSSTITATEGGVSGQAAATVTTAAGSGVSITTWHVDNNRSGLNSAETTLTPANVNSSSFGKLFSYLVDGYAYAEPLIVSNLTIDGAQHDVLYVATEHDDVYAFDADSYGTGQPLWHDSLSSTPLTAAAIQPFEGITSTPVIDLKTDTMYVVSAQKVSGVGTFELHALDLATGAEKFGGPVTIKASVSGSLAKNDTLTTACIQRAALLEANGNIYIGVGDCPSGWLLAYNATTLAQVAVWNASPNQAGEGTYGSAGGVWMGSGGPVADSSGNIYIATGNGPWDANTAWGDSVIKFSPTLQIEDYFTPDAYAYMNCKDSDLASGGLLLIPGTQDLVAGGKIGKLFLLNSANLGHEQTGDTGALDTTWFESDLSAPYSSSCTDSTGTHTTDVNQYEIFGTSAYYNGYVYLGVSPTNSGIVAPVRQFEFDSTNNTLTPGAYTAPSTQETSKGTTPFISSNGNQDGIVWMIDEGIPLQETGTTTATLRAYDAAEFPNELYNSSQNAADVPGYGIKFTSPVVANGRVYISTGHDLTTVSNPEGEIDVYGLK